MSAPNSRETLIDYALRALGHPVVTINVDYQQLEDRLDEALELFSERHFDGVEKVFFRYPISSTDIENKYIDVSNIGPVNGAGGDGPDGNDIVTVVKLFQFGNFANVDMFDLKYQLALVDYFGINTSVGNGYSHGLAAYDATKRYIKLIEDFFQPEKAINFSKVTGRIYISGDLSVINPGDYVIIQAYAALDPNQYTKIYNDRLLKKYVTALIKKQWGSNMAKYDGVQLPGGITLKGSQIYAEAVSEIAQIENELNQSYELPVDFFVG
jgi:hypothetical protein